MKFKVEIIVLLVALLASLVGGTIGILSQSYGDAVGMGLIGIMLTAIVIGLWKAPQTT